MAMTRTIQTCLFFVLLLLVSNAKADWINLTGAQSAPNIAEIHVNDNHIRVVLEVYVGDIDKFMDLLPDEWIRQAGVEPLPIEERMRRFSAETFQIIADDRTRLTAMRTMVEPRMRKERPNPFAGMINPITRQLLSSLKLLKEKIMMHKLAVFVVILSIVVLICSPGLAQETDKDWEFNLSPLYLWGVAIDGK